MQADICIYGATSAGVIAAYTAKKMGKTVILIEPGGHLGGMTSGGLGYTDIGNKYAITGLSRDFYRRIGKHYGKFEQWTFEPKVAKQYLQQYLDEAGIKVIYQSRVISASKSGAEIKSIVFGKTVLNLMRKPIRPWPQRFSSTVLMRRSDGESGRFLCGRAPRRTAITTRRSTVCNS